MYQTQTISDKSLTISNKVFDNDFENTCEVRQFMKNLYLEKENREIELSNVYDFVKVFWFGVVMLSLYNLLISCVRFSSHNN